MRVDRRAAARRGFAAAVPSAVHSHFAREAALQELHRRRILREGRLSLAIGLVLLVLCEGTAALVPTAGLGTPGRWLAKASSSPAGSTCGIRSRSALGIWPVVREQRLLERLAAADVRLTTRMEAVATATA